MRSLDSGVTPPMQKKNCIYIGGDTLGMVIRKS